MTDPENQKPQPWNPEAAVPLFAEFAAMHQASGIQAAYDQGIRDYLEDTGDREYTADTIRALQGDTVLGVLADEDFDEGAPGHKELYLARVNPQTGNMLEDTVLYTCYTLDETVDTVFVGQHVEAEPTFTAEQAELLRQQYRRQEEAGLRIDVEET
jgi:hypothetical protein